MHHRPCTVSPRVVATLVAFVALGTLGACNLPRDADDTLAHVQGGTMRVGMVVDTPWVTDSAGGAGGIEGALTRAIAADVHANIAWVHGTEASLLESVRERELDLVIGGFTATSPYSKHVAFTKPYYTDTVQVAGAPGGVAPRSLEHLRVAVRPGDPTAAQIRHEKGTPLTVADLATTREAVAAPTWRLAQLARVGNPGLELAQQTHVLAVPPGENAWLVRVERLLRDHKGQVPTLLRSTHP